MSSPDRWRRGTVRHGLYVGSLSLEEIRQRVRGAGGDETPLPPARQPEHISEVLRRIGFGKQRGQDDGRKR